MLFVKESKIAATPSDVFNFHESPGALTRLTPPWEKVRLVEGGESLRPGTRAVLEMRVGPLRLHWIAEHTEYIKGTMFADRQISGPFKSWYHRHRFLDDGQGGTLLSDEVEYEPPLGAIGRLFSKGYIERKLNRMFYYRHETTKKIVESKDY